MWGRCVAGPSASISARDFFELAAAAILMFGFQSGAALATVVCGLIDVQAMQTIVSVENCKGGYEGRPIDGQSVM